MNTRILTISSISSYNHREVPYIRMQGIWVEKLGFEIGRKIEVEEHQGLIVIRVAPADEPKGVQHK